MVARWQRFSDCAKEEERAAPPKQEEGCLRNKPSCQNREPKSQTPNVPTLATRPIVPENERGLTWQKRFESLSQTRPWALLRSHSATTGDICGNQNSHHRESILHHRSNNCAPPPSATHHQRRKTALRLEAPSRIVPPMHKVEMFEIEGEWFEQIWVLQIGDFSQIRVRKLFFFSLGLQCLKTHEKDERQIWEFYHKVSELNSQTRGV